MTTTATSDGDLAPVGSITAAATDDHDPTETVLEVDACVDRFRTALVSGRLTDAELGRIMRICAHDRQERRETVVLVPTRCEDLFEAAAGPAGRPPVSLEGAPVGTADDEHRRRLRRSVADLLGVLSAPPAAIGSPEWSIRTAATTLGLAVSDLLDGRIGRAVIHMSVSAMSCSSSAEDLEALEESGHAAAAFLGRLRVWRTD